MMNDELIGGIFYDQILNDDANSLVMILSEHRKLNKYKLYTDIEKQKHDNFQEKLEEMNRQVELHKFNL